MIRRKQTTDTNDYEITNYVRPIIDGEHKYFRVCVRKKIDILGKIINEDFYIDDENMTIKFSNKKDLENAETYLNDGHVFFGDIFAFEDKKEAKRFWDCFIGRLKWFVESLPNGPLCDFITVKEIDLEQPSKYMINPAEILNKLIALTMVQYRDLTLKS